MKEYRKVVKFSLNGQNYNMYLDNNNKKFFLRTDEKDNLFYLNIDELIIIINELSTIKNVMNVEFENKKNNKMRTIPKIVIGGVSVLLSSTIIMTVISMHNSQKRLNKFFSTYSNPNVINQIDEDYFSSSETEDKYQFQEDLVVDTYLESEWLNYLYIYDMQYLDKALNYDNVSLEQLKEVIKNNNKISLFYKNLLYDYCESVVKNYHDIDLRTFYENLKTLEIIECTDQELIKETLNMDSYGCYVRTKNKIYVKKDYEYKKGTWEYQVIFHEFSHCLRTGSWTIDGKKVKVQVEGQNFNNTITAEALNSLFTVGLFDYEELDIAYQLQSNYHKVMIESMDNYSLSDYVTHSLSYYANKLDEFNNDNNYATVILELMQMQYNDFHSTSINMEQQSYYPLYDYVANMYYKKNISENMSFEEAKHVTDELLKKIMYDVPQDYNIDVQHFYDYLNEYCVNIGISSSKQR